MTKNDRAPYQHPVEAMIRKFERKHHNRQNVEIFLRKLLAYLEHKPWPEEVSADELVRSLVYDIGDILEAAQFYADGMSMTGGIDYLEESMEDARRLYHLLLKFPIGPETVKFVGEHLLETADFDIDIDPDPDLGNFWCALKEVQWLNKRFPEQKFRYHYSACLPSILKDHPIEDTIPQLARLLRYLWGLNPEFFDALIEETLAREMALLKTLLDDVEATLAHDARDLEHVTVAIEALMDAIDHLVVLPLRQGDWPVTLARAEDLLRRGGTGLANTHTVTPAIERIHDLQRSLETQQWLIAVE